MPCGLQVGNEVSVIITKVVGFGAFVKLEDGFEVLLPTPEMAGSADELDPSPFNLVTANQKIAATVVKVDRNKVSISNMSKAEREESGPGEATQTLSATTLLGGSLMSDISGLDNAKLQAMVAALPAAESVAAPDDPEEAPAKEEGELCLSASGNLGRYPHVGRIGPPVLLHARMLQSVPVAEHRLSAL